jgi:hypothetical protein
MKKFLISIILLVICSCSPIKSTIWDRPGSTKDELSRDNYLCLKESQQQESNSSIGLYAGNATTSIKTNNILFNACMNAHGWYKKVIEI